MNLSILVQPYECKHGKTYTIQAVDNAKFTSYKETHQEYCQNPDWKEGVREIIERYK